MDVVGPLLGLVGLATFIGGTVWLIERLFRKRPKMYSLVTTLVGLALFIIGIALTPSSGIESTSMSNTSGRLTAPTETPAPTATPIPSGKTKTEPVPYGFPVTHSNDIEVTVLDVTREWVADSIFSEPDEGNEWVIIKLKLRNTGDPNKTESYSTLDFRVTGQSGVIYDKGMFGIFTPDMDTPLESGEFFGGAEVVGDIAIQVDEQDINLVLIYSPVFQGSRYLSLRKP